MMLLWILSCLYDPLSCMITSLVHLKRHEGEEKTATFSFSVICHMLAIFLNDSGFCE